MKLNKCAWIFAAILPFLFTKVTQADEAAVIKKKQTPVIQLALLLDTSGSMDGLLGQAKAQLWKVVNELATAKKNGQNPEIYVALYEYGNDKLSKENGFVRRILPLTDDLDKVSEQLFALRTNGGSEYCGHVIKKAVEELKWSSSNEVYKTIFIAGNEPFSQGSTDYRKSCRNAIKSGVTVNTIYCGKIQDGINSGWKEGATLADGRFMNIDQNRIATHVKAPQDKDIAQLGELLNKTYIPFGGAGDEAKDRQQEQDRNARGVGQGSTLQRAKFKASKNYRCDRWDLVDAITNKKLKLKDIKAEALPESFKKLTLDERKAKIVSLLKERRKIQKQIQKLSVARDSYVAKALKKVNKDQKTSLDNAMLGAVRKQATAKNFKFGE
jgi:hypothetical protein